MRRLAGRIRLSYWVETIYMIANALTKHDPMDQSLWELLTEGWWSIRGEVRIRHTARVANFEEDDLYDMTRATSKQKYAPQSDGEMLVAYCCPVAFASQDSVISGRSVRLSSHKCTFQN